MSDDERVSFYVQERFSLPGQGCIHITWPRPIHQENVELVRDWLKLVEAKMVRSETERAATPSAQGGGAK